MGTPTTTSSLQPPGHSNHHHVTPTRSLQPPPGHSNHQVTSTTTRSLQPGHSNHHQVTPTTTRSLQPPAGHSNHYVHSTTRSLRWSYPPIAIPRSTVACFYFFFWLYGFKRSHNSCSVFLWQMAWESPKSTEKLFLYIIKAHHAATPNMKWLTH